MMEQKFDIDIPEHIFESIKSGNLKFISLKMENYCFQKGDIVKLFKRTTDYNFYNGYIDKNGYRNSKDKAEQMEFHIIYVDYSIDGYVIIGI